MTGLIAATFVFLAFVILLLGLGFLFDSCDGSPAARGDRTGDSGGDSVQRLKIGGAIVIAEVRQ